MRVEKDDRTLEFVTYYDKLSEYFVIRVTRETMASSNPSIMKQILEPYRKVQDSMSVDYTLWVRVPYCYVYMIPHNIKKRWFGLSQYFYNKGHIKETEEGTEFTWKWFLCLTFKKQNKNNI